MLDQKPFNAHLGEITSERGKPEMAKDIHLQILYDIVFAISPPSGNVYLPVLSKVRDKHCHIHVAKKFP